MPDLVGMLSRTHMNTTYLHDITGTLIATNMILGKLECSVCYYLELRDAITIKWECIIVPITIIYVL